MKKRKIDRPDRGKTARRAMRLRQRKTPEELRQIAVGIHRGEIFTDRHCRSQAEVSSVFPIIGMMSERMRRSISEAMGVRKGPGGKLMAGGLLYQHMSEAMPRGSNGLPMFFSLRILTPIEHTIVFDIINRLRRAEAEALR